MHTSVGLATVEIVKKLLLANFKKVIIGMVEYNWWQPHLHLCHFLLWTWSWQWHRCHFQLLFGTIFYYHSLFASRLWLDVLTPNFGHMFILLLIMGVHKIERKLSYVQNKIFMPYIVWKLPFTPSEGDSSSQNHKMKRMISWNAVISLELHYCLEAKMTALSLLLTSY